MTNEQVLLLVVPLVLTQITQIVVLVFGFLNTNKRLESIERRLERIEDKLDKHEERITAVEQKSWK